MTDTTVPPTVVDDRTAAWAAWQAEPWGGSRSDLVDDDLERDPGFHGRPARWKGALCDREPFWRTARSWLVTARRAS